jgi:hypothetical protein
MKCVDSSDKKINEALNGKETYENELIIFKSDIEEFVGLNGEMMGAFKKGEVANIPKEIAKILIDSGKAEHATE